MRVPNRWHPVERISKCELGLVPGTPASEASIAHSPSRPSFSASSLGGLAAQGDLAHRMAKRSSGSRIIAKQSAVMRKGQHNSIRKVVHKLSDKRSPPS
jgi:hypothetical protein